MGADIDGWAGEQCGSAVSLSRDGTHMAVGSPLRDGSVATVGRVRVFAYDTTGAEWRQKGSSLYGEGENDRSGSALAISTDGSRVAIGADKNDGAGANAGHVRVYEYSDVVSDWTQLGSDIDGEASIDISGRSVSLSADGTKLAVGAHLNDGAGTSAGHVRVYEYSTVSGNWTQIGADIDGEAAGDQSGISVSLSGDGATLAVGASLNDGSATDAGHVRVFNYTRDNDAWIQLGSDIDGEAASEKAGFVVSLSDDGSRVAVSAHLSSVGGTGAGVVRVYEYNASGWSQLGSSIVGEAEGDLSGWSLSLSGDGSRVAIGAQSNGDNGVDAGHVRVFEYASGVSNSWEQLGSDIDGEAAGDNSGLSVSLSVDGQRVAVGAPLNAGNGTEAGHVRVYQIPFYPTSAPSGQPSSIPTVTPSSDPSSVPSKCPTSIPSVLPSSEPSAFSTSRPSSEPSALPSCSPSSSPSASPSWIPSCQPLSSPSSYPSASPSALPSGIPSHSSTELPTTTPLGFPTISPSGEPSGRPSILPITRPSGEPTCQPSMDPSSRPSLAPSSSPSYEPSGNPTITPAADPSSFPTCSLTARPSQDPSGVSTGVPSGTPSLSPTSARPSGIPSHRPTELPTTTPLGFPTISPSGEPSGRPSILPSTRPSGEPTCQPSMDPSSRPSLAPSSSPSYVPSENPTTPRNPTASPTAAPSYVPSSGPSASPTKPPSISAYPSIAPSKMLKWVQVGADIDGWAGEQCGSAVSLSRDGTHMAVGSPLRDGSVATVGRVRVFAYDATGAEWRQKGSSLYGEGENDRSGSALAISTDGSRVAIGADKNDGAGANAGHVRVYEYSDVVSDWTQLGSDIDGEASIDISGRSVSLSADGTKLAVGAHLNDGAGTSAGHVRVYEYSTVSGNWTQIGADIDGEAAGDQSGISVSLSGDGATLAVGASLNDGSATDAGHVRVFNYTRDNDAWIQLGSDIDGEAASEKAGFVVSLSDDGSRVAVSAHLSSVGGTGAGVVRVYEYNASGWSQLGSSIVGEAEGDLSGWSLSLSGDGSRVAIGAQSNGDNGVDAGHVRVFEYASGVSNSWEQLGSDIDGEAAGDNSGLSVSLSVDGQRVAVGAPLNAGNGTEAGHVRVYQIPFYPTSAPSGQPSSIPTVTPSSDPSSVPSKCPTSIPSVLPSSEPSAFSTSRPSSGPSALPSCSPSSSPSASPSWIPSCQPLSSPSSYPSASPSALPSGIPSHRPTELPTTTPLGFPTISPSGEPSGHPSILPSTRPSGEPTCQPSMDPSSRPSLAPSSSPSYVPSGNPTTPRNPTASPTAAPSYVPSSGPSASPTKAPSISAYPSIAPSKMLGVGSSGC